MADETMFERLHAALLAELHRQLLEGALVEYTVTFSDAAGRVPTVRGDLDAPAIVRALLTKLRDICYQHSDAELGRVGLRDDADPQTYAYVVSAACGATLDAILAETESGGASAQPGAG